MSNELNIKKNNICKNIIKNNKKRHELSENKNKSINKIKLDIIINFDWIYILIHIINILIYELN